ncbi:MAG: hypothetical protein E7331_08710 [Clostridiales bacterium]|nr:hypothetical protein [Clostridiales bacterium]
MGARGAFVDVNMEDFTFVKGGQQYQSIGMSGEVKVLIQTKGGVKAPEFSHTPNRVYAVVQDGKLKHIAYYDDKHKQAVSIDLLHEHKGVKPHRHEYMSHNKNDPGIPPTPAEMALIRRIKKEYGLQ